MADIDGLKQRIELIDLRLKTAHSARERESAALVETWEQIRSRFQSQSAEILSLRERIRVLEDAKEDLQGMVNSLLGAVEGGLERMSDETVSNIRKMANELLSESEEPRALPAEPPVSQSEPPAPAFDPAGYGEADDTDQTDDTDETEDDDFLAALERSANAATNPDRAAEPDDDDVLALDTPMDAPVSPGIRDLIARIEENTGDFADNDSDDERIDPPVSQESPEELEQDLLEIEQLRNELLGLRQRISGTGS